MDGATKKIAKHLAAKYVINMNQKDEYMITILNFTDRASGYAEPRDGLVNTTPYIVYRFE